MSNSESESSGQSSSRDGTIHCGKRKVRDEDEDESAETETDNGDGAPTYLWSHHAALGALPGGKRKKTLRRKKSFMIWFGNSRFTRAEARYFSQTSFQVVKVF